MSARQSDNIQETISKSKNQKFIFPFTSSSKNNTQTNYPLQHLVPLKDFTKYVLFKRYINQIMNRIRQDQRWGCLRERFILPLHIKPRVQSRFFSFLHLQEEDVSENEIYTNVTSRILLCARSGADLLIRCAQRYCFALLGDLIHWAQKMWATRPFFLSYNPTMS